MIKGAMNVPTCVLVVRFHLLNVETLRSIYKSQMAKKKKEEVWSNKSMNEVVAVSSVER